VKFQRKFESGHPIGYTHGGGGKVSFCEVRDSILMSFGFLGILKVGGLDINLKPFQFGLHK